MIHPKTRLMRALGTCLGLLVLTLQFVTLPNEAKALNHPGALFSTYDLQRMKANLNIEPWKTGYANLQAQPEASLNYTMKGPFSVVGRDPSENLSQFESDMKAVCFQAVMWQMTGNSAYAAKATQIADAWATKHTSWSGATPYLTAGWSSTYLAAGCEILRYTYSGWTATNTTHVQNYMLNVIWTGAGGSGTDAPNLNVAAQGAYELRGLMPVAVFCDDTTRFNNVVSQFLNHPCAGLRNNTLSTGQFADMGRDQGHARDFLEGMLYAAETAWKQGVDLFGSSNNRLLGGAEYYTKYNLGNSVTFQNFGACYGYYTTFGAGQGTVQSNQFANLAHGAYVIRKGLSAPYTVQYLNNQTVDFYDFLLRKDGKTPPNPDPVPSSVSQPNAQQPIPTVATSLTSADVGSTGLTGSASFSGGVWTVKGAGNNMWNTSDSFQFAYRQMTGDGVIIARVTGETAPLTYSDAGVMMREKLTGDSAMMQVSVAPPGNEGVKGIASYWRPVEATDIGNNKQFHPNQNIPCWVKIERKGNVFTGYDSPDGVNWTPTRYMYSAMAGTIYVGLVVCSHDTTQLDTATFEKVAITGATGAIPDGTYRILNRATGKFLDNLGSTADGALLAQWSDSTSANQQWQLTTVGSYRKITCVTGGKRLDSLGNTATGSNLGQWTDNNTSRQEWTIRDLGTGYYKIINHANGLYLDSGGQTADGDKMKFWTDASSNNLQWSFVPTY